MDDSATRRPGARRGRFSEFWPEYLEHHLDARNRALHEWGTISVLGLGGIAVGMHAPWMAAVGLVAGYGLAFSGHYLVEGNAPATLRAPLFAGVANCRMFLLSVRGRLDGELRRFGLGEAVPPPWWAPERWVVVLFRTTGGRRWHR